MIYANILIQEEDLARGLLGKIKYCGGSSVGGADYTNIIHPRTRGVITTPLAQQQLIITTNVPSVIPTSIPDIPVIPQIIYTVTTFVGPGILSRPINITIDSINNLYVSDLIGIISKVDTAGNVTLLAGQSNVSAYAPGIGTNAKFNSPRGMKIDSNGNIYVADSYNNMIRKIDYTTGNVTIVAGQTTGGFSIGIGTNAKFDLPSDVAIIPGGNIAVVDVNNNMIRNIDTLGNVTTIAGQGKLKYGSTDGIGTNAQVYQPYGVTIDSMGNLYIAQLSHCIIRKIDTTTNYVATVAGQVGTPGSTDDIGTNAKFNSPRAIAVDSTGNLYVADLGNHTIRKIDTTTNYVTTVAGRPFVSGSTDGNGTNAQFNQPSCITIDSFGNLYVVDAGNHTIRKITITTT